MSRAVYSRQWRKKNPEYGRAWRARNPDYVAPARERIRTTEDGLEKWCSICREWWPAVECFTTCSTGQGGFHPWCNACRTAYRQRRRAEGHARA